jgi:cell division septum initiation protein DivIVA
MAKEKKLTVEEKFTLVLEQNEQLLKEIENLEIELYEYKQIFDSIIKKFGNDVMKMFTERERDEITKKELPN